MVCQTEVHLAVSIQNGLTRHPFFERTLRIRRRRWPRVLSVDLRTLACWVCGFESTGRIDVCLL
jgi:hypothetical protein